MDEAAGTYQVEFHWITAHKIELVADYTDIKGTDLHNLISKQTGIETNKPT